MHVWALADLHLCLSTPEKSMEAFGDAWKDYITRIEKHWHDSVDAKDLVLLPGDISWAMTLEKAKTDLKWIDSLPGTKVMIKGNHDYWWGSKKKVKQALPPSLHIVQNDSFTFSDIAIAGSRLWDSTEYNFDKIMQVKVPKKDISSQEEKIQLELQEKIFLRECNRLEMSLKAMPKKAKVKIAMTHYPPIGWDLKPSRVSKLFEKYQIDFALFGHLHNVDSSLTIFGEKNGVTYYLTSCDYLQCKPKKIL